MSDDSGMTPRELRNVLFQAIIFTAALIISLQFIAQITGILLTLALVLLLTIVLNPAVTWAERHRIPRTLSAVVLALATLGSVAMLIWLISPIVVKQFRLLTEQVPQYFSQLTEWLSERAPGLAERIPRSAGAIYGQLTNVIGGVVGYAWNVVDVLTSALIVLAGTIYALSNPTPLVQGLLSVFPRNKQDKVVEIMRRISEQMRAFALATLIGMFAIFALTWLALTIIGVQPAFLFALIAGFMELIPLIGPILSAIPPIFAALITGGPITVLYVVLAFLVIQQLESQVIIPVVQSSSLQLHPLSIIFAVLIMAGLFGIIGIFLAAPTAAVVKILYEELYLKPVHKDTEEIEKRAKEIVGQEEGEGKASEQ